MIKHKTSTVDYLIVIKGEMYAILDTEETLLKPMPSLYSFTGAWSLDAPFSSTRERFAREGISRSFGKGTLRAARSPIARSKNWQTWSVFRRPDSRS